jgi:hypothetical protein
MNPERWPGEPLVERLTLPEREEIQWWFLRSSRPRPPMPGGRRRGDPPERREVERRQPAPDPEAELRELRAAHERELAQRARRAETWKNDPTRRRRYAEN